MANPFAPPTAVDEGPTASAHSNAVPESVVALLAQTRPWVKFIAVLVFACFGLCLLLAVGTSLLAGPGNISTFVPLLTMLAIYVPAAVFLWRYADSIRQLQAGGGQAALESALRNQKSLWKFMGVMACLTMAIFFFGLVAGFIVGRGGG
jgi:hypothetical protein